MFMKRKQFVNYLLWFIILCWAGIATVYWALNPNIASFTDAGLHARAYQMLKGFGFIGSNLMLMIMAHWFSKDLSSELIAVKGWVITWFVSVITCLFAAVCFSNTQATSSFTPTIFNSLFPLIRGTYPLTFGLIIGLLINQLIKQLSHQSQSLVTLLIFGILIVGSIHFPNIWGWDGATTISFYILLTLLGARLQPEKFSTINWLWIAISSELINAVCQFIIPIMCRDKTTIGRFSTPYYFLTVLTAYALACLVVNYIHRPNEQFSFNYLTIIQSSSLLALLNTEINNHGTIRIGFWSLLYILVALVVSYLGLLVFRVTPFESINHNLKAFCELPIDQQQSRFLKNLRKCLPNIFLLIISYFVSAFSLLAVNIGTADKFSSILHLVFTEYEGTIYLGAFFCFISIKFFQAITKRFWLSSILVIIINVIVVIANILKIQARQEPILPADIKLASVAGKIFGMVSVGVWTSVIIAIIISVLVIINLEKHFTIHYQAGKWMRTWLIFLAPLAFISATTWNHTNSPISNLVNVFGDSRMFWNQTRGARQNGPIIQFLNNVDVTVMKRPSGYSKKKMDQIKHHYQSVAKEINTTRTNKLSNQSLVFVLSESFANPNYVPGVKLKNNPIPYITSLEKSYTGGKMISSGYGGGTANMEYMALTGFAMCNFSPTLATPYSQLVTSLKSHPSIVDNFKYAVAIHPYDGAFYNRINVYKKFGFNKFFYLGSRKYPIRHQHTLRMNHLMTDETSYENTLDQLRTQRTSGIFVNLVTMQNHFPYDLHHFHEKASLMPIHTPAGTNISSLEDYTNGINYTDRETKAFIQQIDKIRRPITIVFYGDHLPGNIYSNSMAKDGLQLHETDYFIYSNRYAREHGARTIHKSSNFVSPSDFIAMSAMQTNSKVNWYQALLTQIYQDVPVFARGFQATQDSSANTNTQFVSRNGKLIKYSQMTKKQKRIYHDYQLVQYDITAGHHYLVDDMK